MLGLMKTDEALKLLAQVAAQYRGTLEDHQNLQLALQTLAEAVNQQKAITKKGSSLPTKR